ncbi:MAG: hypothetical protein IJP86_04380 [Synergistaceae bacterium]|nr:hypothetical protein [Synergistaceae bacterium]
MIVKLERCPYCGGEGELYTYGIGGKSPRLYLVRCEKCGNGTCADEDATTVVKLWNTRADNNKLDKEETVKVIYISLPEDMSADEKYAEQKRVSDMASDCLNATVELREAYPDEGSDEYEVLSARIKSLGEAEYVIFPDEWEMSRESRIEYETAIEYGKRIMTEHGDKLQEEV